jgi:hypothetical protein
LRTLILALLCSASFVVVADDKKFPGEQFLSTDASLETLWLDSDFKQLIKREFDYDILRMRLRYWRVNEASAWILEEIGKEKPITFGITIDANNIVDIEILAYRESRGGEIQYPFFREQFEGLELETSGEKYQLNGQIDGITGATLSVRAMKKVAKVALFLHKHALAQ